MTRRDSVAEWFEEQQKLLDKNCELPSLATIEISDAAPPAFDAKKNDEDVRNIDLLDVENLLGCYRSNEKRIVLWRRGIEFAARRINHEYETLFELVVVHEFGHWFHNEARATNHAASSKPIEWKPGVLDEADTFYHEAWAQWFTWTYAKEHASKKTGSKLLDAFLALERRQSAPYKTWRKAFSGDRHENNSGLLRDDQTGSLLCRQKIALKCLLGLRLRATHLNIDRLRKEVYEAGLNLDEETQKKWGDISAQLI